MRDSHHPDTDTQRTRTISIHASTWEAAASEHCSLILSTHFNSRLYMRGSNYVNPAMGRDYISIHASTWEAAPAKSFQTHWCVISIHASTWEAASPVSVPIVSPIFQFTPLHERQQFLPLVRQIAFPYFNSRLYMRGSKTDSRNGHRWEFQFTPLHERQPFCPHRRDILSYFNSRLYMRGSGDNVYGWVNREISIHASTWEAATIKSKMYWQSSYFNSRLYMRGSGGYLMRVFVLTFISIHASTWEAAAKIHNFFNKIDTIFYQTLFFYSNFSEGSLFFNSSSIFLINCIFLPAPMSHKKMYESHQRTHF